MCENYYKQYKTLMQEIQPGSNSRESILHPVVSFSRKIYSKTPKQTYYEKTCTN